jgi:hypothetical protein
MSTQNYWVENYKTRKTETSICDGGGVVGVY